MSQFKAGGALILVTIGAFLLNCSPVLAQDRSWHPSGELARLPLADDGGVIAFPVRIGKREWICLLDASVPITILDTSLLRYLGQSVGERSVGNARFPVYSPPSMTVQNCAFKPEVVALADLTPLQQGIGFPVSGILGADSIRNLVVHMDFENETLLFCDVRDRQDIPGKKVDLQVGSDGIPYMEISYGGPISAFHCLDTSLGLTAMLDHNTCNKMVASGTAKVTSSEDITFSSLDKPGISKLYRIKAMAFGQELLDTGAILVAQDANPAVGRGFLSRFTTTLSTSQRVAFLKQTKTTRTRSDHPDADGIRLIADQKTGRVIVSEVQASSIAAKSGVSPGDVITSIGKQNVQSWPQIHLLRALTSQRDADVPLSVVRQGKELKLMLPR